MKSKAKAGSDGSSPLDAGWESFIGKALQKRATGALWLILMSRKRNHQSKLENARQENKNNDERQGAPTIVDEGKPTNPGAFDCAHAATPHAAVPRGMLILV